MRKRNSIDGASFLLALLFLCVAAVNGQAAESQDQLDQVVFSTRRWEGEYFTNDTPGQEGRTEVTGAIYRVNVDGTDLQKVVELGGRTEYPLASPDGHWIYFQSNVTGRSQIYRCRPDGKEVANLTLGNPLGETWTESFGPSLSVDGKQLMYVVHDGKIGRVVVAAADGSQTHFVAPHLGYIYMASFNPQGDKIVFSGPARGYRLMIAGLPDGEPRLLTPDHPDSYAPQFTPDGATIFFFRRDGDLYTVDADGRNLRTLTRGNQYVEFRLSKKDQHGSTDGPQLSPDGKTIAYMVMRDDVANIHLIGIDGTGHRQVTHRDTNCGRVRWHPNGRDLAFVSFVGKYPQLFVTNIEGRPPRQVTDLKDEAVYFPQWLRGPKK